MIQSEKQGLGELLKISLPYLLICSFYSLLILFLEEHFGDHIYKVSGQIGSVFGLAVAFFLGFRMNSAYDRWWEARKIFGELTNNTRSFVAKVYVYCKNERNLLIPQSSHAKAISTDLVKLSIIYVQRLNDEIHQSLEASFDAATLMLFSKYQIDTKNKISNEILIGMSDILENNFSEKSNIEKGDLMQHINRFYEIQGKAERIRNTPFLKIYSAFTKIIVGFYILLMPLFIGDIDLGGEESGLEFLAIPIMVIISSVFLTINKLANLYGEPFAETKTAVPIDRICTTIENNCQEVLAKIV